MVEIEELLAPISDDAPAGADLEYADEYATLRAHRSHEERDDDGYPTPAPKFDDVVDTAREILEEQSKDIRVALYLAEALLNTEGFGGFHGGLEVVHQILERFPEEAHPVDPAERAYALDYLVGALQADSRDVPPVIRAIELFPLSEWGHHLHHFQEWKKNEKGKDKAGGAAGKGKDDDAGSDELSAANFTKALVETSKEYYRSLSQDVPRCIAAIEALDAWGKEYFDGKIEPKDTPLPRYTRITTELTRIQSAAVDLLARKLEDDPDPVDATAPAPGAEVGGADAPGPSGGATAATGSVSAKPTSPEDAAGRVVAAARFLREQSPTDPAPYMMMRGLRWGELRSGGTLDARLLEPPEMSTRRRLKGLLVDQSWEELLEAGEDVMGEPCGRGWLDLQRYILTALENLGPTYGPVSDAIRGQLSALLSDLPQLADATMMDDLPTTNAETRQWLELSGLLGGGGEADAGDEAPDYDQERVLAEATHERALALAASGNARSGIEMLMKRADREDSMRARFITESLAASIMVDAGMVPVAKPILEDLEKLIEARKLAEWEAGEVVARPLGLLFRCLTQNDRKRAELYDKICRLDPVHAMTLDPQGGGGAQAAKAAAPAAAGQAFQPNEPAQRPQSGEAVDPGSAGSTETES